MTRLKTWANRFGTLLFVGGAIAGGWMLLRHKGAAEHHAGERPAPPPVAVTTTPVTPRPVQRTVAVVGSLFGRDEIAVAPSVAGRVVRVHKDVGDTVRPGDVLLEIDPTDYQLKVAEAERSLQVELAKLGLTTVPAKEFDLKTLPAVVRASARQQDAARQVERVSGLALAASRTEQDAAQRDHQVSKAEYTQAVFDAGTTLATTRLRQAALDTALQQLKDTRVCVPGDSSVSAVQAVIGDRLSPLKRPAQEYVVTRREVSEGEYLHAGPSSNVTPFRLVIERQLKLLVTVPERHKGEVSVGQAVRLRVESHPGQTFQGEVARVNPSVDRASRTFQVEVNVPNDDRRLSPGSFVKADILTRTDPTAATVPEEAIVSFAGVTKVFVVVDGRAKEVPVKPGPVVPNVDPSGRRTWVEVSGTFPKGAVVVTSGHAFLADGVEVRVRDEQPTANTVTGGRR